jgi:hypothetical protein
MSPEEFHELPVEEKVKRIRQALDEMPVDPPRSKFWLWRQDHPVLCFYGTIYGIGFLMILFLAG